MHDPYSFIMILMGRQLASMGFLHSRPTRIYNQRILYEKLSVRGGPFIIFRVGGSMQSEEESFVHSFLLPWRRICRFFSCMSRSILSNGNSQKTTSGHTVAIAEYFSSKVAYCLHQIVPLHTIRLARIAFLRPWTRGASKNRS